MEILGNFTSFPCKITLSQCIHTHPLPSSLFQWRIYLVWPRKLLCKIYTLLHKWEDVLHFVHISCANSLCTKSQLGRLTVRYIKRKQTIFSCIHTPPNIGRSWREQNLPSFDLNFDMKLATRVRLPCMLASCSYSITTPRCYIASVRCSRKA